MTKFVGAEFLIACMLIQKNVESVNLEDLGKCGVFLQSRSVGNDIDAVFLTSKSQVVSAIYDFSDYFDFVKNEEDQITAIKIVNNKKIEDLQKRFMGYLPEKIMEFIEETIKEFAA